MRIYKHNIKEPFLYQCAEVVCEKSKDFPSLKKDIIKIVDTIKTEEIKYLKTLGKGIDIIESHLKKHESLDAQMIFTLYDTYGFPYEITEEIASEKNITLDKKGYDNLMLEQKNKARKSKSFSDKSTSNFTTSHTTEFLGYNRNNHEGILIDLYLDNKKVTKASNVNEEYLLVLSHTTF